MINRKIRLLVVLFLVFAYQVESKNLPYISGKAYNISEKFIPEARLNAQMLEKIVNVVSQIDQELAQSYVHYFIQYVDLILNTMIDPLLVNFDAQVVQNTNTEFQTSLQAINEAYINDVARAHEIISFNPIFEQFKTIAQENATILRTNVLSIRTKVLQNQFENEEQIAQARATLYQLRYAYQFILDELQDI